MCAVEGVRGGCHRDSIPRLVDLELLQVSRLDVLVAVSMMKTWWRGVLIPR